MTLLAPPAAAASTSPPPASRRRLRRVLFLLGLPPLLVALGLALKVGTMLAFNSSGRDAFSAGHVSEATTAFRSTMTGNVLDRWVAPYDLGTSLYRQQDYAAARAQLEDALGLAPDDEVCRVRINLALADEALGDAAVADGDVSAARARWSRGRRDLAEGGCTDEAAPEPRSRLLAARTVDSRLRTKLKSTKEPEAREETAPEDAESLEERNQRAEERRRKREERREEKQNPPPVPGEEPPTYQW